VTNLQIAVGHLNKVVIKPGQTFSIWRLVGRPTKAKGYLDGMTLHNGQIGKDTGGGLCQLGNLLYWMALHSPLSIKERWRHSFDVFPDVNRTIPFACGATLAFNYIDLQLQNQTAHTFQINLWLDNTYLNGEITCDTDLQSKYEIYETDHQFQQQIWGGYTRHNKIWRRITNLATDQTTEELVTENNAIMMYSPLLDQ
jgi:vancomycin resistance protein VanW